MKKQINTKTKLFEIGHRIIPIIILIAGVWISTQIFAEKMNYSAQPNNPIGILNGVPIYAPYQIVFWIMVYFREDQYQKVINDSLTPGYVLSILAIISYLLLSLARGRILKNTDIYGSSREATEKELKDNGLFSESGIILGYTKNAKIKIWYKKGKRIMKTVRPGRLIIQSLNADISTLLIGGPRSGKGLLMICYLLSLIRESIIILDIKGENYELTSGFRRQFSHILKLSITTEFSCKFNILNEIPIGKESFRYASLVAEAIIYPSGETGQNGNVEDHFNALAASLLTGVILYVLYNPLYMDKSLPGVLDFFTSVQITGKDKEDMDKIRSGGYLLMQKMVNEPCIDMDIKKIIADTAQEMMNKESKEFSGVISTAVRRLWLFRDPIIRANTSTSDFTIKQLRNLDKPISLYITIPYTDISRVSSILRLFLNFIVKKYTDGGTSFYNQNNKYKMSVVADEFTALGKFSFLHQNLGIVPGFGITFLIICQSLQQLSEIYGQNHSFLDVCRTQLFMDVGDIDAASKISKMIGQATVTQQKYSESGSKYSTGLSNMNQSNNEMARDLFKPDEILRLPQDNIILIRKGMPVYMAKKVLPYDHPIFKNRYNMETFTDISQLLETFPVDSVNTWLEENRKGLKNLSFVTKERPVNNVIQDTDGGGKNMELEKLIDKKAREKFVHSKTDVNPMNKTEDQSSETDEIDNNDEELYF